MRPSSIPSVRARGTILIVDDSDTLRRRVIEDVLAMDLFERVHEASDGFAALRLMKEQPIDIVLCDLEMPRCSGFDLLRLRRGNAGLADIPIVMLTSAEDVNTRIKVLSAGASDYVCKPAHPQELRARLGVHLRLKLLLDDLRDKGVELERLARTDTLTKLANRGYLDEVAKREHARCARYDRPMSVVMLDLDHFKVLNDTHGHAAGDLALEQVAGVLRQQVRGADLAARYGGEEFTVVMPETCAREAAIAAERIRRAIAQLEIVWEGERLPVTASLGVAGMPSARVQSAPDLFARADEALYAAKEAGRNVVQLAAENGPCAEAVAAGNVSRP